jgi:hypothetical protein
MFPVKKSLLKLPEKEIKQENESVAFLPKFNDYKGQGIICLC